MKFFAHSSVWLPLLAAGVLVAQVKVADAQRPSSDDQLASHVVQLPMAQPQIANIAYNTYLINEFGADSQYLLIGKERALLIDTGTGFYDIKATVEKLTKLPYDVVATHSHPDHIGMIGAFDTVYMNKAAKASDGKERGKGSDERGGDAAPRGPGAGPGEGPRAAGPAKAPGDPINYCRTLFSYTRMHFDKQPEVKRIAEGQTFDLGGGRVVTAYMVPGHTEDSVAFLDRQSRILFSGDAYLPEVPIHGKSPTAASTRLRSWIKMQNMSAEYDRVFYGHAVSNCELDIKPMDPAILGNLIEIYRQVLRGGATTFSKIQDPATPTKFRAVLNNAQADVELDNLWEPGEAHIVP